jgi:hypothetical protein
MGLEVLVEASLRPIGHRGLEDQSESRRRRLRVRDKEVSRPGVSGQCFGFLEEHHPPLCHERRCGENGGEALHLHLGAPQNVEVEVSSGRVEMGLDQPADGLLLAELIFAVEKKNAAERGPGRAAQRRRRLNRA